MGSLMDQDKSKSLEALTNEVRVSNQLRYSPVIKPLLDTLGPVSVVFGIQNVSNTPAIDLQVEFWVEPVTDYRKKVFFPILNAGEKKRFFLPESDMKTIAEKITSINMVSKCKNLFNVEFTSKDSIDTRSVLNSWITAQMLVDEPLDRRIKQMSEKLESIERTLGKFLANTGGLLVKSPEDEKKELEVIMRKYQEQKQKIEATDQSKKPTA